MVSFNASKIAVVCSALCYFMCHSARSKDSHQEGQYQEDFVEEHARTILTEIRLMQKRYLAMAGELHFKGAHQSEDVTSGALLERQSFVNSSLSVEAMFSEMGDGPPCNSRCSPCSSCSEGGVGAGSWGDGDAKSEHTSCVLLPDGQCIEACTPCETCTPYWAFNRSAKQNQLRCEATSGCVWEQVNAVFNGACAQATCDVLKRKAIELQDLIKDRVAFVKDVINEHSPKTTRLLTEIRHWNTIFSGVADVMQDKLRKGCTWSVEMLEPIKALGIDIDHVNRLLRKGELGRAKTTLFESAGELSTHALDIIRSELSKSTPAAKKWGWREIGTSLALVAVSPLVIAVGLVVGALALCIYLMLLFCLAIALGFAALFGAVGSFLYMIGCFMVKFFMAVRYVVSFGFASFPATESCFRFELPEWIDTDFDCTDFA
eukprot:TRINITY_DN66233_c0_g1_i1.p1 TRINITY_DN66233_c0_g1~~TRINITY_DN66233_c0_g1_i1.p1  ORF type:complete len:458 (+),score=21.36 TRINITY_DN66233_c0_g1_i1:79-1374(+)